MALVHNAQLGHSPRRPDKQSALLVDLGHILSVCQPLPVNRALHVLLGSMCHRLVGPRQTVCVSRALRVLTQHRAWQQPAHPAPMGRTRQLLWRPCVIPAHPVQRASEGRHAGGMTQANVLIGKIISVSKNVSVIRALFIGFIFCKYSESS